MRIKRGHHNAIGRRSAACAVALVVAIAVPPVRAADGLNEPPLRTRAGDLGQDPRSHGGRASADPAADDLLPGTSDWSIVTSPNASGQEATSFLNGMTCTASSDCWAVGYQLAGHTRQTFIERWDGTSWAIVDSPNAGGMQDNALNGVTCSSASLCWAVGYYSDGNADRTLIQRWDGTSWTIVTSPNALTADGNVLNGVTCASASDCWAVGSSPTGGTSRTLIVRWDGVSWTLAVSPDIGPTQPQDNQLYAVTCMTTSDCWTVGYSRVGNTFQTFTAHWNGASWVFTPSANTSATQANFLQGVTCTSASDCWAVGYARVGGAFQTLIERWDGTAWTIVSSPNTSTTQNNRLLGVTCISATDCWAVGSSGNSQPLAERWDGTSWTIVAPPNVTTAQFNQIHGVTCVSASECWAVGFSLVQSGGTYKTLVVRWDGTSWNIVNPPNASATQKNFLNGVTCVSTSDCWAVGHSYISQNGAVAQTLIERWDGTSWTISSSPSVGSLHNFLHDVTCVSMSDCWAVGSYFFRTPDQSIVFQTLIMRWDGASWTVVPSPNESTTKDNRFSSVTCTSSSNCWTVGYSETADGYQPLTARWDGTSWTTVASPTTGTIENLLFGVTCPSTSDCWAVGYDYSGTAFKTLVMRWDGTSWAIVPSPNTKPIDPNFLRSVTCVSTSDCWAAGHYVDGPIQQTLILRWDGTSWTIVESANTSAADHNFLNEVTCASASACWAVGRYFATAAEQTLILGWDGTSWEVVASPNANSGRDNILNGVSCASVAQCWTVGFYNAGSAERTLILRHELDEDPEPTPSPTESPSPHAYPRPGRTEAVAVGSDGAVANGMSDHPVVSGDGRFVVFRSWASNLVPGDTNGFPDVFLRDRDSGVIERISVSSGGAQGNNASELPAVSGDGRFVTFKSWASNLVSVDTNGAPDTFVRDRATGVTTRVSVASDGTEGNNPFGSFSSSISADGRYVAFTSWAPNLVADDANGTGDVFVHDRQIGVTTRVSVASDGTGGNGNSGSTSISADGRYVTFHSLASNLVPGDTNLNGDVFVHDRGTGTTERVSVATDGTEANGNSATSSSSAISADGRYVAFTSWASTLVPADTNEGGDAFMHDRETGITERVSVASDGTEGNDVSITPSSVSADGRYVTFNSYASNLSAEDTNEVADAFVHDRETGITERLSVDSEGREGTSQTLVDSISRNGRWATLSSFAFHSLSGGVLLRDRGPAVGVGEVRGVVEGDRISVSGWATFSGHDAASASDSRDDAAPGAAAAGAELTEFDLIFRPERDDLLARWSLTALPGPGAGSPGVVYGLEFDFAGQSFEIRALRSAAAESSPGTPHFALFRCDAVCVETARLSGGLGTLGAEVRVALPLELLGATAGSELSGLRAYTALGEAATGEVVTADEITLPNALLAVSSVTLATAPSSVPEDEVEFTTPAEIAGGNFFGSLTVSSETDADRIWARACLGQQCGAASTPVTLDGDPSPSASPSVTVPPTPEPTATPSSSPVPEVTEIAFSEASATSGQYSDDTFFEARLVDSDGDPIAEAEIAFELTGAASSRSFSATTDHDGIASITPTLKEKPGAYQLTVRYDGDDAHAGSADTIGFVVEREDTELDLTVTGKGKNRTLTARLSDRDTASEGIAGRTIDFYADGELIGTEMTNGNGVATLGAPPGYRGGKHDFEASFDGDDYYRGSSGGDSTR